METDSGLYKLVSEYYEARILYGLYSCGDSLPSISKICAMFRLAPATVRSALGELERAGYLKVDARRTAKVIYRIPRSRFRENAARYFVPREEGIRDLTLSGTLLLEPLLQAGLNRRETDWAAFLQEPEASVPDAAILPVQFYLLAMDSLQNRLALNLYWEAIRYLRFPYLGEVKEYSLTRAEPGGSSGEGAASLLDRQFQQIYKKAAGKLFAFIRDAKTEYSLEQEKPVPFRWNINRQRPQLRYSLASRVIRGILSGQYPVGSFLPSLPKMVEQYGVSRNTVRRSLALLELLGVVKAHQGKGIQVYMEPQDIDCSQPDIQVGLRLYLESLQLLTLTIPRVARYTMETVSPEQYRSFLQSFQQLRKEKREYLCFEISLALVEEQCPLAFVRECYGRIRELLIWGYPFTLLRLKDRSLRDEYAASAAHLEQCLKSGPEAFSAAWSIFLADEEQKLRSFLSGLLPGPAGFAALVP